MSHDRESVRVGIAGPGTDGSGVSRRVYRRVAVLRARRRARHQPDPARTPDCAVRRAVADGLCGGSRDLGVDRRCRRADRRGRGRGRRRELAGAAPRPAVGARGGAHRLLRAGLGPDRVRACGLDARGLRLRRDPWHHPAAQRRSRKPRRASADGAELRGPARGARADRLARGARGRVRARLVAAARGSRDR